MAVRPSPLELHLLKLLFLHEELAPWLTAHLDIHWLAHPLVRQIVDARFATIEHETWHNLAEFLDTCESAEARSLITEAVADERRMPNPEIQFADVALKLRNQFLDQQIAALTQQLSSSEMDETMKLELLQQQQALKARKRSALAPLVN
jgi:hypothetical protein